MASALEHSIKHQITPILLLIALHSLADISKRYNIEFSSSYAWNEGQLTRRHNYNRINKLKANKIETFRTEIKISADDVFLFVISGLKNGGSVSSFMYFRALNLLTRTKIGRIT
jgi:hypothetical protein